MQFLICDSLLYMHKCTLVIHVGMKKKAVLREKPVTVWSFRRKACLGALFVMYALLVVPCVIDLVNNLISSRELDKVNPNNKKREFVFRLKYLISAINLKKKSNFKCVGIGKEYYGTLSCTRIKSQRILPHGLSLNIYIHQI